MNRSLRLLLGATLISSVGDWLFRLALPLIVYESTGSPARTALVYALEYAPVLVASPFGGLLADRLNRKRLLLVCNIAAMGLVTLLVGAVSSGTGGRSLLLYAIVVLLATVAPLAHPTEQSLVPALAESRHLRKANSYLQAADPAVAIAGPALAGVLLVALGPRLCLLVDGATFALAALLVTGMRIPARSPRPSSDRAGYGEACTLLRYDGILTAGTALFMVTNLVTAAVQADIFFYVVGVRHLTPSAVGAVFMAQGAGALAGALLAGRILARHDDGLTILLGTQVAGACVLCLAMVDSIPLMLLLWGAEAAAGTATAVAWFTLRQRRVPSHLLGRVVALTRMAAFVSIPAGSLAGGVVLGWTHTLVPLLFASGGVQVLAGTVALRTSLGAALRRRDSEADGSAQSCPTKVAVVGAGASE